MTCEEVQELIHPYIDGELDLVRNVEIECHLSECEICRSEHRCYSDVRTLVQGEAEYFAAPEIFKKRIALNNNGASERTVGAALRGRPWLGNIYSNHGRPRRAAPTVRSEALLPRRWVAAAAAVILALSALLLWTIFFAGSQSRADNLLAQEVVASHIRSMMVDHLVDVPSSDQHTVKPWFNGKLDFAPSVKDLADNGFPLAGGRLDYIDNRTVAVLVYQRRKHSINLFIFPSPNVSDQPVQQLSLNSYNLVHWTTSGTSYWAVSDVNSTDLSEFAKLLSQ